MTDSERTVALLIDYDNLQICYSRDAPGTQLDLGAIMALAQSYGRVVVARAYAEWNLLSERMAVYKAGIEPAFAPVMRPEGSTREGKSLADTVMVSDGVDLLWALKPDVLVLVTSDKDMIPLARLAKQRGALVVVLGSDLTAVPLLEMANDFVTYRHLVRELGRPDEQRLPVSRGREEPRTRRPRETGSAREVAAALEASARQPRVPQSRVRSRPEPLPIAAIVTPEAPIRPPVEAAPTAFSLPAAFEGPAVGGPDLAEDGTPAAPRRRRRRGGRGRRIGVAGEEVESGGEALELEAEHHEPSEEPPSEPIAAVAPLDTAETSAAEAPAEETPDTFDAAIEAALTGAVDIIPPWARRLSGRSRARPRPVAPPAPAEAPEVAAPAESEQAVGAAEPTALHETPPAAPPESERREAPASAREAIESPQPAEQPEPEHRELRPWERWPERTTETPRSSARIPLRRARPAQAPAPAVSSAAPSETISPAPAAEPAAATTESAAATSSPVADESAPSEQAAVEPSAAPPDIAVAMEPGGEAANGAASAIAGEPAPAEEPAAAPAPPKRRRTRRRPAAAEAGESSPAAEPAE